MGKLVPAPTVGCGAWWVEQVTQWEGQVVDNANHSFLTRSWGASRQSDLKHWGKFAAFGPLRKQVMQHSGR